ncbi:HlyD family type I secretion periplasmic adaptor subunit [Escherichia coli]|uniref:HlyD family type I secretion periplasmic adaptor subunit n=1 Tax=Escherichia coli TaxID=562 RepID=UPI001763867A|nr:HlyD family type I secretion periplasmic adaptor subunit [Escherichia coli]EFE4632188.1 HlyD family type I secretion periplasmic adaptor subunit [Escherichia coli]EFM2123379.1 HlyD family type I secretion periplasmic adaptor subunit [Escherichia coli]EGK5916179.1 HlyD family type I secretion periplasmic adaptor subunit [Escherichia coli]MCV5061675.1 HlyD family type I secretion periplasmic adaptor subunit [Escherichia coli]MCZ0231056.1 HlyD family type I secretion periplasmic adaptor subuni
MKYFFVEIKELVYKYNKIIKETWKIRKELDSPVLEKDEYEFLPAHLELIEKPASKYPRMVMYLILLLFISAFLLSILGRIEIVASAEGKLTLNGRSKEIKPIENSIVNKILVKEGDEIKKGQVLLKLTALGADADALKTYTSLRQAKLEMFRYRTLEKAINSNRLPELIKLDLSEIESINDGEFAHLKNIIMEQFHTWQSQKKQKSINVERKKADKKIIQSRIKHAETLCSIEKKKLDDYTKLLQKKAISSYSVLEQENKYFETSNELSILKNQLTQIDNEILLAKEEYNFVTINFRNEVFAKLQQIQDDINLLMPELAKNKQRQQASLIKSPVSGKVQQLKVHTEGGVVTTAEPLMIIVPKNDTLEVTALVRNKDIGFIQLGQDVIIKLEAFPYTRYGYLTGKVKSISPDAVEHAQLGLVFNTIISIDNDKLLTENGLIPLSPGMVVTAEIKTGMRSIISFLLSPLEASLKESLRER